MESGLFDYTAQKIRWAFGWNCAEIYLEGRIKKKFW